MNSLLSLFLGLCVCLSLATGGQAQDRRWVEWTGGDVDMGQGLDFV